MLTTRLLFASIASILSACSLYSSDPQPDAGEQDEPLAVQQCTELADSFCAASDDCGGVADCREWLAPMCARNLTIVTEQTMRSAQADLAVYECVPNEVVVDFPDRSGRAVLDAMLVWPNE